jgi:hypothetical protein
VSATQVIADFLDYFLCCGTAHFGLRAGPKALRDLDTHLDGTRSSRHGERLRVGIGDDEFDALQAACDHIVDRIAAGTTHAEHGDPRFHLSERSAMSAPRLHGRTDRHTAVTYTPYDLLPLGLRLNGEGKLEER